MKELLNLSIRIRSEAQAVRQTLSTKYFNHHCHELTKRANESLQLWQKARENLESPVFVRTAWLLRGFWCKVLSESTHFEADKHLLESSAGQICAYVLMVEFVLCGDKHPNQKRRKETIGKITKSIISSCIELGSELRAPGSKWPRMASTALLPAPPDYSQQVRESDPACEEVVRKLRIVGGTATDLN